MSGLLIDYLMGRLWATKRKQQLYAAKYACFTWNCFEGTREWTNRTEGGLRTR